MAPDSGEKVIWPSRGVIACSCPSTGPVNVPCPGAMLPPWLRQTYVALMLSAVRKASVGPLPSPAAFPLQVRTPLFDLLQVGVPMKCALLARRRSRAPRSHRRARPKRHNASSNASAESSLLRGSPLGEPRLLQRLVVT